MKRIALILGFILVLSLNALAEENKLLILEQRFIECTERLDKEYDNCPESWSTNCYYKLLDAHQNTQKCYKQIAIDLFVTFYGLSEEEAEKRFDKFSKSIYDQYLFVFSKTNYCKKNNCGINLYLHSEYATTEQLHYYVNKIIKSILARN